MSLKIELDPESLRPLIESVIAETLARVQQSGDRLMYTESEAASLLGMARHQLRDRRLQGDIIGRQIGGRWYYKSATLRKFAS